MTLLSTFMHHRIFDFRAHFTPALLTKVKPAEGDYDFEGHTQCCPCKLSQGGIEHTYISTAKSLTPMEAEAVKATKSQLLEYFISRKKNHCCCVIAAKLMQI